MIISFCSFEHCETERVNYRGIKNPGEHVHRTWRIHSNRSYPLAPTYSSVRKPVFVPGLYPCPYLPLPLYRRWSRLSLPPMTNSLRGNRFGLADSPGICVHDFSRFLHIASRLSLVRTIYENAGSFITYLLKLFRSTSSTLITSRSILWELFDLCW